MCVFFLVLHDHHSFLQALLCDLVVRQVPAHFVVIGCQNIILQDKARVNLLVIGQSLSLKDFSHLRI
jgi:hypothetical protein